MPNIINETEDEIDYVMEDGRPDDDDRDVLHAFSIRGKDSATIKASDIPAEVVNHRFISSKSKRELARIDGIPRTHDALFGYRCETKEGEG